MDAPEPTKKFSPQAIMTLVAGVLALVVLFLGFTKEMSVSSTHEEEKTLSSTEFPVTEQKSFVVLITAHNAGKYCERSLRSVFEQNYSNYRVIYVDDMSTDDTYQKVRWFTAQNKQNTRVTLLRNNNREYSLASHYKIIQGCKDNEIVISMDGNDWLPHEEVLSTLNRVYANPDVWMTYGQYIEYPTYALGSCHAIPKKMWTNNSYKHHHYLYDHLKTCYAGLFKKIRTEDLQCEGNFLSNVPENVWMLPLLEMAQDHAAFVPDILYVYNAKAKEAGPTEFNEVLDKWHSSLPTYEPLTTPPQKQ